MFRQVLSFILIAATAGACLGGQAETSQPTPPTILFIGNSFTAANGGIDAILNQFSASPDNSGQALSTAMTSDGATLKQLWSNRGVRRAIQSGAYRVLILQADIPESDVATFQEYTRDFVGEARQAGTRPVLLMAWAYDRLGWITQDEIALAHEEIGRELGIDVAPVGLAWSRVKAERPTLDLYAPDREHPSASGSYLAACVVYATVTGGSPAGKWAAGESFKGMDAATASYLEGVAWDTVQTYQREHGAP